MTARIRFLLAYCLCLFLISVFCLFSMSNGHLGLCKDFPSRCCRVKNPVRLLCNLVDPSVIFQATLCAKYLLKPNFLPDCLKDILMRNLLHFIFRIHMSIHRTCHQCQFENIHSGKRAHLIEDWSKIFISCRYLCMPLEATILQDFVKSVSLVNRLSTTVNQCKALEPCHINLVLTLILGCILKRVREKYLAKHTVRIFKRLPRWRGELGSERH